MSSTILRLLVATWVLFLLGRAAVGAWRQRDLTFAIWRRIGWRHVAFAFGLFVLVSTVAITLLTYVPPLRFGLGTFIDFSGNAVFVPLEETATRPGAPAAGTGPDWFLIGVATAFLGFLALLLPWLAFVEEEVFRAGLEKAGVGRQIVTALVFGLAHMIMFVPLAAALTVGAAGYVYGLAYRRAYWRLDPRDVPEVAARSFRPTRRSAAAAEAQRATAPPQHHDAAADGTPAPALALVDVRPERRQAGAVLASTVLHTAFNSIVVVLVWLSVVLAALDV